MKKIRLPGELAFVLSTVLLALAVAILTEADFGISMIVAPAYLLSLKSGVLTFGQAEYVIQAGLFLVFCLIMRRFRPIWLMSFFTCLFYGAVLDLWRMIPAFNPQLTPPDSLPIALRIGMFAAGVVLTSFSVALVFKSYLYPQVYDFFVKGISEKFSLPTAKCKTCFDLTCLLVSVGLSLLFFGRLEGIGVGTLVMAVINGTLIGGFLRLFDRTLDTAPLLWRFAALFEPEKNNREKPCENKAEECENYVHGSNLSNP